MRDFFLADDLSGALDAAGAFHRTGQSVTIAWDARGWEQAGEGIVAFTTETRNTPPAVAAATVSEVIVRARRAGARLIYKKIDSTLRGPVAAEVAALAREMPEARILFAPANPAVGRTVREGVLRVHGIPVADTEFGRDPVNPVRESDIRRLLADVAPGRITIPDAATPENLAAAVAAMDTQGGPWVAVGSGALARPVAARLKGREPRPPVAPPLPPGPILMLCGSAHAANRHQAAMLERARGIPVLEFRLSDAVACTQAAIGAMQAAGGACLLMEERRADSAEVLRQIALAGVSILQATGARRVFVTGGESAYALGRHWGMAALAFRAEIESGLCVAESIVSCGPVLIAIKPGGFGDDGTWVRAWDALMNR